MPLSTPAAFRLRFSLIDGPELRCPHCGDWWPITPEHWAVRRSEWHMCIPCKRERSKLYARLRFLDPAFRSAEALRAKRYRKWLKKHCPEYLTAYDRERKALARSDATAYRASRRAA